MLMKVRAYPALLVLLLVAEWTGNLWPIVFVHNQSAARGDYQEEVAPIALTYRKQLLQVIAEPPLTPLPSSAGIDRAAGVVLIDALVRGLHSSEPADFRYALMSLQI